MEIVYRGKAPKEFKYDGVCTTCHSILKAEYDELKHEYSQRDGDMVSGTCPVCSNTVWFTKERF